MVEKATFREDLYYRLNVVNLRLPRLCEREGDIPRLVEFFLTKMATKTGKQKKAIAAEAMVALEHYAWPGNIRQLENELQRAEVMSGKEGAITLECLSPHVAGAMVAASAVDATSSSVVASMPQNGKLKEILESLERELIAAALKRCDGNKSEAARQLGISRSNLIAKAQTFGLDPGT
jgi:DNA-binding NtrC family response regulator